MRLGIRHTTRYEFSDPVVRGLQRLRLKPKSTHGQRVLEWKMELDGAREETEYDDHLNNQTTLVSVVPGVRTIEITCTGTLETAETTGVVGPHASPMPLWAFLAQTPLTSPGAHLESLAAALEAGRTGTLDMLHALSQRVLERVRYTPGATDVDTSAERALTEGHGVCQDHAHIFVGAARLLGVPARYVSGYLKLEDRIEQEAGHGWAEAHVDGLGWVGFDVSNGISPDERYVRVATGFDYRSAAPVTGLSTGARNSTLDVRLAVEQQPTGQ